MKKQMKGDRKGKDDECWGCRGCLCFENMTMMMMMVMMMPVWKKWHMPKLY